MKTNKRYLSGRFDFDGAEGIAFWVGDSDTEPVVRVMFDELEMLKGFLEESFPGLFPRATEPDAATCELIVKFDGGRCAVLNRDSRIVGYFPKFAEVLAERDAARTAAETFRDLGVKHKAERDAALDAVERVRSAVNGPHPANSGLDSFTLAHVSSALDGADTGE